MEFDQVTESNMGEIMEQQRQGQLKFARENETARNRLIALAVEAEEMGII
jgi:hypothetical protein